MNTYLNYHPLSGVFRNDIAYQTFYCGLLKRRWPNISEYCLPSPFILLDSFT